MKIIKNTCFGGYGLSVAAQIEVAKRKGKDLYFFALTGNKPLSHKQALADRLGFVTAYTVPDPYERGINTPDADGLYKTANRIAEEISINFDNRTDPDIIAVVEKLGEKANGRCADLEVVEIPDGIEYEIDGYDGMETIREKHRTW